MPTPSSHTCESPTIPFEGVVEVYRHAETGQLCALVFENEDDFYRQGGLTSPWCVIADRFLDDGWDFYNPLAGVNPTTPAPIMPRPSTTQARLLIAALNAEIAEYTP